MSTQLTLIPGREDDRSGDPYCGLSTVNVFSDGRRQHRLRAVASEDAGDTSTVWLIDELWLPAGTSWRLMRVISTRLSKEDAGAKLTAEKSWDLPRVAGGSNDGR